MESVESVEVLTHLDPAQTTEIVDFLERCTRPDGSRALSDHAWLELRSGGTGGFVAAIARRSPAEAILGYGQASAANDQHTIEVVVAPDAARRRDLEAHLLGVILHQLRSEGGGPVTWWVADPDADHARIAATAGLRPERQLYQMRRELPVAAELSITTRPFRPGIDEDAWLEVNNRAFVDHGEQGGWDLETLQGRMDEPWFDPEGFVVLEIDGRLVGSCWTKPHPDTTPPMGEIYVISVDPAHHGHGYGAQLTLAGLDVIHRNGFNVAMLYVDAGNEAAVGLYRQLGFTVHRIDQAFVGTLDAALPRWSVADVHEHLRARSFLDALDAVTAEVSRTIALFDAHAIRGCEPRPVTPTDVIATEEVLTAYNTAVAALDVLGATAYATVATDSRDEHAQGVLSELETQESQLVPLLARLAEWVKDLGVDELAEQSDLVDDHRGPLRRLAARATYQMSEEQESLYAELTPTGSSAWARLQQDVTSQLTATVTYSDGRCEELAMPAVRGLASHVDPSVRRAAYEAERATWPRVATPVAAAMNAIKGEATTINRRRGWADPLDASLFANSVSRETFDAMHAAVTEALPDFHRWMRAKAQLHRPDDPDPRLAWWDLIAPLPVAGGEISWEEGIDIVRDAFGEYAPTLARLVDRALEERWIDAEPRPNKVGGAFCMPFVDDRSLLLLNWAGSIDSAQTTAHELGHAYHNTTLAARTPLQKRLPMALAETASIFCETLVVEAGLNQLDGDQRFALLDVDLASANQVLVDIRSRFLFEREVFVRRARRTLGASELDEMMLSAQAEAYGDGLDPETAHPHMWLLKPHYYGSHFYNWPYTYGLLFGLGLFAQYREDPERFRSGYDTMLSRAGMDTAEQLGERFGLDVRYQSFWNASVQVLRDRISEYLLLASAAR